MRLAVLVTLLVAEIVAVFVVVTVLVLTIKVAELLPAATVTPDGTVATEVALLDRLTTVPPVGAGPVSVTVPVDGEGPFTVVGLSPRELRIGAVTVSVADRETPSVPVIDKEVLEPTGLVVTVNVAAVEFAATVTLAGTCATKVLLLSKVTTVPPTGAGPVRVTVPVEGVPPVRDVGLKLTALRVAAVTVKFAVSVTP